MQWKGRKLAFIVSCVINLVGWIITYFATSVAAILTSECLLGLGASCILVVGLSSIAEMIAPTFRNICMVTYYITETTGIAILGVLGKYVHWRTISLIMCCPLALAILVVACTWPESPYWLAYKGQYGKCKKAFIYLRGKDEKSKQELSDMILKCQENDISKRSRNKTSIVFVLKKVKQRDFYLPSLFMFILLAGMYWSGVLVGMIYIEEIVGRFTNKIKVITNIRLVVNIMYVVGAIGVNIMNKFLHTKTVILINSVSISTSSLLTSIVTYLHSISVLSKQSILPICCLYIFATVVTFGINSFTVAATLMPVKHKGLGGALFVIFTDLLHASSLKLSPYLLVYGGVWALYLTFGLNAIVCGVIIWKFVPETKGRTLQEIEEYYENLGFKSTRPILDSGTKLIN